MLAGFELIVILALLLVVYRQGSHHFALTTLVSNLGVKIEALALKVEKLVKK